MIRTLNKIEYNNNLKITAKYAKALAHPTRIAILKYLAKSKSCITGDIVNIFPQAQSTISQHLKALKKSGLIQGEVQPPKVKYCINKKEWEKAKTIFISLFNKIIK